ncbi:MAG: group 1 glycosyl transferase, partial [Chloroflexota bacterium]
MMHQIKIAHITSAHSPLDTRIFWKECRSLAHAGFRVLIIASHFQSEIRNGIEILAVPEPTGRIARMTKTVFHLICAALKSKAEIFHLHDPELLPVAIILKLTCRKVIFDLHEDLCADVFSKEWIPVILKKIISKMSKILIKMIFLISDKVVCANPDTNIVGQRDTTIIHNFPRLHMARNVALYEDRPNIVVYIGSLTIERGLIEVLETA